MVNTIEIRQERASMGTLATAAVKALLKFLTSQSINTLLAFCAFISVMCWLLSGAYARETATWCCAWVLHFAAMSSIDIRKGGVEL